MQLRAADTEAGLTREPFVEVFSTNPLNQSVIGRFAQVRAILIADRTPGSSVRPVLCNVILYNFGDPSRDCNGDGAFDSCEFDDCNHNCAPDDEEIAGGWSADWDLDGVPDECLPPTVTFVDVNATGDNDGTSWQDAYTNLQTALATAVCGENHVFWVADGTYKPAPPPTGIPGSDPWEAARAKTFRLTRGVALYGGFAGDEDPATFRIDQRDFAAHRTVLSGDLNGDGTAQIHDSSFNVVTATGADSTTLLDGFTIQDGVANAEYVNSGATRGGAGMFMEYGSPTVRNCVFYRNLAVYPEFGAGLGSGGAIMAINDSSPTLINCSFLGNAADTGSDGKGGGVCVQYGGTATLVNCVFSGNRARFGGGVGVFHAHAIATNCTFSENVAQFKGGAIDVSYEPSSSQQHASTVSLRNCVLWGNEAPEPVNPAEPSGKQISNAGESGQMNTLIAVDYCDVEEGISEVFRGGGGILNWGANNLNPPAIPLFANARGPDNLAGTLDDNLRLGVGSLCRDAGDNAAVPAGVLTDIKGDARVSDGNGDGAAVVDLGAYETCPPRSDALPDWEPDCDIDLADFAAFQVCRSRNGRAEYGCLSVFELVGETQSPCGFIDLADFSSLAGYLPDPDYCGGPTPHPTCCYEGENCCSESMAAGGGESMAALGDDLPSAPAESENSPPVDAALPTPPEPEWAVVVSPVVIELRPVGGGEPVTVLAPGSAYDVRYSGAQQSVQGYLLTASTAGAAPSLASAAPATAGAWSNSGLFEFLPLDDSVLVLDDLSAGATDESSGMLCRITTGQPGGLTLMLRLYLCDPAARITYEMAGEVTLLVGPP